MPMPTSKKYCAEVQPRAGSGRLDLGGHHLTDACALTAWPSLPCTVMHRLRMRVSSAQTGPVLLLGANTPGSTTWSHVIVTMYKAHSTHVHQAVPDTQLFTAAAGHSDACYWQREKAGAQRKACASPMNHGLAGGGEGKPAGTHL